MGFIFYDNVSLSVGVFLSVLNVCVWTFCSPGVCVHIVQYSVRVCIWVCLQSPGFLVRERAGRDPEVSEGTAGSRQRWHKERTLVTFAQWEPTITAHWQTRSAFTNEKNKEDVGRELAWHPHAHTQWYVHKFKCTHRCTSFSALIPTSWRNRESTHCSL